MVCHLLTVKEYWTKQIDTFSVKQWGHLLRAGSAVFPAWALVHNMAGSGVKNIPTTFLVNLFEI
jgi:hypothetical protein